MTSYNQISITKRILIGLVGGAALGIFVFFAWSFLGFGAAASATGARSETLGYAQILLVPFGALAAGITGLVMGLLTRPDSSLKRWFVAALILAAIGFGINVLIGVSA